MANLVLTAKRKSPSVNRDLTTPKMILVDTENILKTTPFRKGLTIVTGKVRPYKRYRIAETPGEYDHASKLALGLTTTADGSVNLAASGTTQATALPVGGLTAYQNIVTAATGGSQAGVILPPASTKYTNGGAFVVKNITAVALSVYPAASEYIDSGASNAPATVAAFGRRHFYASASNTWKSAGAFD